ncbi:type 4a pilus biogenesis protein PilO [candidate division WWE3 bacterium]|nr:type 4a pilus biogenesis protein PilO [candidate division WWE3 bacterium]
MKLDGARLKDTIVNFLVPLIALGVSALAGVLFVYPGIKQLAALKGEVKLKESLNSQLILKLEKLNTLLDFKETVDEDSGLVSRVLSSEAKVPELLTQIDIISKESGLEVTKLSYSFGDAAPGEQKERTYESVTAVLGVKGNFTQLETFLNTLERSGRVVTVDSLRYALDTGEGREVLEVLIVLSSPYKFVNAAAVADDPIDLDITSEEFLSLIDKLKALKIYDISPDKIISLEDIQAVEEATPSAGQSVESMLNEVERSLQ